jgi:hypothetical protein
MAQAVKNQDQAKNNENKQDELHGQTIIFRQGRLASSMKNQRNNETISNQIPNKILKHKNR